MASNSRLIVVLTALVGISGACEPALAQKVAQETKNTVPAVKAATKVSKVELLANKNKPPLLREGQFVSVDKAFDWKEHDRCWGAIHDLFGKTEAVWPELIAHLDDDRYCATLHNDYGGALSHWSVGRVCRLIVHRTLTEPFYSRLQPESVLLHAFVRAFPIDPGELKKWCEQRREKPLYELQMEACLETIRQLEAKELMPDEGAETRAKWVATIERVREELSRSRRPRLLVGFGVEEFRPLEEESGKDPFE